MKSFLILQLREMDEAADREFEAFLRYGGLDASEVHRVRMEKESFAHLDPGDFAGIIVGGGPSNVSDQDNVKPEYQLRFEKELNAFYKKIMEDDIPYLGSCYGLGSLIKYAGGEVSKEKYSEPVGTVEVQLNDSGKHDPLLKDLPEKFLAFCGHKEACQFVPEGGLLLGSSDTCPVQVVKFGQNIYAVQFHCELDAEGLAERIRYYKNDGYFEPEEADNLINDTKDKVAEVPHTILKRFVERYR